MDAVGNLLLALKRYGGESPSSTQAARIVKLALDRPVVVADETFNDCLNAISLVVGGDRPDPQRDYLSEAWDALNAVGVYTELERHKAGSH